MSEALNIYIYAMSDPSVDSVAYIGKSINTHKRLMSHWSEANESAKGIWISGMRAKKIKPQIDILDVVPYSEWSFWEKHYISLYKSWGFELVNSNNGGGGCSNHTQETKDKIRATTTGVPKTEEHKQKIRLALTGQNHTQERIEKIRKSNTGHVRSPDSIKKQIASNIGRVVPAGVGEKISKALTGVPHTKERKRNNSIAQTGKVRSEESKKKQSEKMAGVPLTEDHKNNIRLALTGKHHTPERVAKMRASLTGVMKGVPKSAEHRKKIGDAQRGKKKKK